MTEQNGERTSRVETAINKVEGTEANYLAKYIEEDTSLNTLIEQRTVPCFKIIQPTTDADLKKNFGEGTVIVRPGDTMICKYDVEPKSFDFVPLFFFMEWRKWRDLKGSGPMVLDRTHDATHEIARKSKNAETRKELYQGHEALADADRLYNTYVEHLRFVGIIYGDHPLVGTPVTLSFERGEWGQGKNFISAVSMRRQKITEGDVERSIQVPLWAQVWRLSVAYHAPDQTRKWYGFSFAAPEQSIVKPEEAEKMQALHKEFSELFNKQRLMVIDEPDEPNADDGSTSATPEF
jgi:hypothetical protein